MYANNRRIESTQCYCLFNPKHNVIARTALIIAKVMVETQLRYFASGEELYRFVRPIHPNPTIWRSPLIVEIDFHVQILATSGLAGRGLSIEAAPAPKRTARQLPIMPLCKLSQP